MDCFGSKWMGTWQCNATQRITVCIRGICFQYYCLLLVYFCFPSHPVPSTHYPLLPTSRTLPQSLSSSHSFSSHTLSFPLVPEFPFGTNTNCHIWASSLWFFISFHHFPLTFRSVSKSQQYCFNFFRVFSFRRRMCVPYGVSVCISRLFLLTYFPSPLIWFLLEYFLFFRNFRFICNWNIKTTDTTSKYTHFVLFNI